MRKEYYILIKVDFKRKIPQAVEKLPICLKINCLFCKRGPKKSQFAFKGWGGGGGGVNPKILYFLSLDICYSPSYLFFRMGSLSSQFSAVAEI